jgi:predicted PurR-regulated permease PerM
VAFTQASQLVNNAPHYVNNIVHFLNSNFGTSFNAKSLIHDLQSRNGAVQKFGRNLAHDAPDVALTIGKSLFEIIVTIIFAFYLTANGPGVRRAICSRLPRHRQQMVLDTWELAVDKTGSYLYSRLLQAIACTAVVWVFLFALGIPSALALAIWVGVVSQFVPTVGTYIALVLPALVTLVNSPVDTIWVMAFLVGYQQFENYYLGPRIARFTLKIHPALTIGVVFAGALLLGPIGALLALPATAVIQSLISAHTDEQEVIETPLTAEPARRARRFQIPRALRRRRPEPEPAARESGTRHGAGAASPATRGARRRSKRPERS